MTDYKKITIYGYDCEINCEICNTSFSGSTLADLIKVVDEHECTPLGEDEKIEPTEMDKFFMKVYGPMIKDTLNQGKLK